MYQIILLNLFFVRRFVHGFVRRFVYDFVEEFVCFRFCLCGNFFNERFGLRLRGFDFHVRLVDCRFVETKVGDRYVLEEMLRKDYSLGGEQSGHIIFRDFSTTGDGQLTAVQVLSMLCRTGTKLSDAAKAMTRCPQFTVNIPASAEAKQAFCTDHAIACLLEDARAAIGPGGRLIARPSGTEPLIRIMAEGEDPETIRAAAESAAARIAKQLGSNH